MLTEKTVKCSICGRPYKVYSYYTGDQSACPKCIEEAENNKKGYFYIGSTQEQNINSIWKTLENYRF